MSFYRQCADVPFSLLLAACSASDHTSTDPLNSDTLSKAIERDKLFRSREMEPSKRRALYDFNHLKLMELLRKRANYGNCACAIEASYRFLHRGLVTTNFNNLRIAIIIHGIKTSTIEHQITRENMKYCYSLHT